MRAIFDINVGKVPGADGFTSGFFQTYWSVNEKDIFWEVQSFFTSRQFPPTFNVTHIRLIPKVLGPTKVYEYRHIVLCYVFYKIIAKILTKGFKIFFPVLSWNINRLLFPGKLYPIMFLSPMKRSTSYESLKLQNEALWR